MMTPLPEHNAKDPLRVVTKEDYRWQRADIKVTSLVANSMLRNEALSEGYDDAILIRDGLVTEATAANVFIVRDGVILTPPPSRLLLHGVTRDHVVWLARR
jgi:D-alanine transaminase